MLETILCYYGYTNVKIMNEARTESGEEENAKKPDFEVKTVSEKEENGKQKRKRK